MNHTEFYREYRRRKDKAIELAALQYPALDRHRIIVTFFPTDVLVGVYSKSDEFVKNIIIDGNDLDV